MSPGEGGLVQVELRGAVALVTLNRPHALNALDRELTADLERAADRLQAENGLKVAVTCGAGRAFCAGNDLKEIARFTPDEAEGQAAFQGALLDRWAALPLMTIAAVHGFALGGGLVLAAAHDFRVASEGARLGLPEITLGFPPGYGLHRLVRLLGEGRAREVILSGTQLDAVEARRIGLVNRVVSADRLLDEALAWAAELARLPRGGIGATKRVLAEIVGPARDAEPRALAECLATEEAQARLREFLARRRQG